MCCVFRTCEEEHLHAADYQSSFFISTVLRNCSCPFSDSSYQLNVFVDAVEVCVKMFLVIWPNNKEAINISESQGEC